MLMAAAAGSAAGLVTWSSDVPASVTIPLIALWWTRTHSTQHVNGTLYEILPDGFDDVRW